MTEQQLTNHVQRAQAGDQAAFGDLFEQFEPTVFGIVFKRLRNHAEADETTQDVFIQAMRKLPQLREAERFPGWIRQIAVRMSINRAVRRPREKTQSPETFHRYHAAEDCTSPLEDILQGERSHQLWGGLNKLRDLDRETLIAFYFDGQSLKEMSTAFASPIGTIKRRLHTARNRLREELVEMQSA